MLMFKQPRQQQLDPDEAAQAPQTGAKPVEVRPPVRTHERSAIPNSVMARVAHETDRQTRSACKTSPTNTSKLAPSRARTRKNDDGVLLW